MQSADLRSKNTVPMNSSKKFFLKRVIKVELVQLFLITGFVPLEHFKESMYHKFPGLIEKKKIFEKYLALYIYTG